MANYGYIRVSTCGQNPDRQIETVAEYVGSKNIFIDKASGKNVNRPELEKCLNLLEPGDALYCHSLDRLARNLKDLMNILALLKEKGIAIHFLKENIHIHDKDDPVSELIFTVIASVAQFELSLINTRREEGWQLMKEKRREMGKPTLPQMKIDDKTRQLLKKELLALEDVKELSIKYGLTEATLKKMRLQVFKEHGFSRVPLQLRKEPKEVRDLFLPKD